MKAGFRLCMGSSHTLAWCTDDCHKIQFALEALDGPDPFDAKIKVPEDVQEVLVDTYNDLCTLNDFLLSGNAVACDASAQ